MILLYRHYRHDVFVFFSSQYNCNSVTNRKRFRLQLPDSATIRIRRRVLYYVDLLT